MNSTYSACSTLYVPYAYSACLLYTSYVCLSSAQLSSTCLRESFAPSTVYGLLLHVTMFYMNHLHPVKSTVFYFMWQRLFYTRPLLLYPTYMHFMCFSATVPVHVNHLHPVQSLFFYFTWQQFLQYIYSQHAASTAYWVHSLLRLQHVHALHVPLSYSTCLRESFAPSTVYVYFMR